MSFDPSQPYEEEAQQPSGFDPSQSFDVVDAHIPDMGDRLETLNRAANEKPDIAAKFKSLADRAGVPYQVAKEIPESIETDLGATEWRNFSKSAPSSSKYFDQNPDHFALASDDHSALSAIERGLIAIAPGETEASYRAAKKTASETLSAVSDSISTWDNRLTKAGIGGAMAIDAIGAKLRRPDNVNAEYVLQYRDQSMKILDMIRHEPDGNFKNQLFAQWGIDPATSQTDETSLNQIGLTLAQREFDQSQSETDRGNKAEILTDMSKDQTAIIQQEGAKVTPWTIPWAAAGVTDMIGQILPAVAAGFVGGPVASAAAFGLPVAGESFATGKESGMGDGRALENAAVYTATETLGEMVSLGAIKQAISASTPLVRRVGEAMLTNFSEEQATQIMQQAYEAARNGNPVAVPDYIQSLDVPEEMKLPLAFLDDQLQAGVIGMFGGGAVTAVGGAASDLIKKRIDKRNESAGIANETQKKLIDQFSTVSSSMLGQRDKKSLQQLMDAVAEDEGNTAPTHMLVSAEAFKQGGIDPEIFKTAAPSVADQVDQAIQLGGTISVPVGELFTGFAGTGMEQTLTEHMKVSEDAWTAFESNQSNQQEALDQFAAEAEKIRAEQTDKQVWDSQAKVVYDGILSDLNQSETFDKKVNQAYATLVRDFYSVMSPKLGMTPDKLFEKDRLRVGSARGDGAVLNQPIYSDEEIKFLNDAGIDVGAERSNVKERSVDEVRGYDEFNHRIRSDEYGQLLIESAIEALGVNQDNQAFNVSNGATSDGDSASGEVHDRSATLLKRVRKAADTIIRKDLKGDFAAERVVNSSLGPFTGYRTKAEVLSFPGSDYSELRIHFYGKEQDEAGLSDLPALTVFVDTQGAFTVNGPAWGSKTFDEFQSRGWAEDAKGKDGKIIDGYTRLVTPGAKGMPNSQLTAILAETHARLREGQKESRVLVDWTRVTGATGDGETGRTGARYFQNNDGNRAEFNPTNLNINLLETADLSSFLHETGHFFLEMYSRYADQSAEVARDMDALLTWFGIEGADDIQRRWNWHGMTLDEQRIYHEKFAESFEQYLFEGKAPSVELQPLFGEFKRWLASVYKSLSRFLASHNGASLTAEVRGVMDRMIATQEQIIEVAEVRASKAMFTTQEQSGMTDAQWKTYQEDQKRSIEQPITELTGRSLRDMRFLSNAKGKALKKLQREAEGLRREARIDARREVLTKAEYRAWLFLNRKTEGTKPEKRLRLPADEVDPSVDSLLAAVAKLGGLRRSELSARYGYGAKDFKAWNSGVFGKPVVRKDGGVALDEMARDLSEYGYMNMDEHGKTDVDELDEMLFREVSGDKVYSQWADYDYLLHGDRAVSPTPSDIDHIGGRLNRHDLLDMYGTNNPDVKWEKPVAYPLAGYDNKAQVEEKKGVYNENQISLFDETGSAPRAKHGNKTKKPSGNVEPAARIPGRFATTVGSETVRQINAGFEKLDTPEKVAFATSHITKNPQEVLLVLVTDKDHKPISILRHAVGMKDSSSVDVGIVSGWAVNVPGGAHIWISHNHPSGKSTLSQADAKVSSRIDDLLRGTHLQSHGIMAVTHEGRFGWNGDNKVIDNSAIPDAEKTVTVDVVERELKTTGRLSGDYEDGVTDFQSAVKAVLDVGDGYSGLMLLDAQYRPIGFVPVDFAKSLKIRGEKLQSDILGALEFSNAVAAISFSADNSINAEKGLLNVGALIEQALVRPLDVLMDHGSHVRSWANDAMRLAGSTFQQSTKNEEDLFVAHNLSAENLRHADELGGLAAPSLGVSRTTTGGFTGFGEITLLADKSILTDRDARTFDADVYSPRHPRAVHKIDNGAVSDLEKETNANQGKLHGMEMRLDSDSLERRGVDELVNNDALKNNFLVSKGIIIKPKMKAIPSAVTEAIKYLKKTAKHDAAYNAYNFRDDEWFIDLAKKHYADEFENLKSAGDFSDRDLVKYGPFEEDGSLKPYLPGRLATEVESYHKNGGQDKYANQAAIAKKMRDTKLEKEFIAYAEEKFSTVSKEKRLVKYTKNGNAKYSAYNLDNIVAAMTEQLQGGEGFNYGAGSVRSAFAFEFKHNTVESIKSHKGGIVSKEEMNKVRDEANDKLGDALDQLKRFYKYDSSSFGYSNDASSAIAEGPKGQAEAFRMTAESKAIIKDLVDYLRALPSEYFETKMQRAVSLGEFDTAVVPKESSAETLEILKRNGIQRIEFYDPKKEGSRTKSIAKQRHILFQPDDGKEGNSKTRSLEGMGMVSNDGLHPDVVADLFGLSSGDELVRKLLTIDDPMTAINKRTDDLMMQRHSEFTDPKAMERMAEAAIHNEARVRFVATELAMLNKAMGGVNVILKAAKMYANEMIGNQKIGDLRPAKHAADAARAGREADRLLAKGKTADVVMAKRNQVLHTETARLAFDVKAEVDKGLAYFKRLEKAINNGSLDPDYGHQIISLLEQYDLRKSVSLIDLERRDSLSAWVQKQQDKGFEPVIPDHLLQTAAKTHYKRMTVDEYRDLVDAVKNIEHLGRLKHNLLQKARKRALNAGAGEISESITGNAKNTIKEKLEGNSILDGSKKLFNGFLYMHRKFSSLLREMDGWKDNGIMWDYFGRTMNDAGDHETRLRESGFIAISDLMNPLLKSGGFGMIPSKKFIPEINDSLSREGRIMVALNWGNDGNRQRLLDGDGWTPEQAGAILKTLTKQDWEFVQGVWDFIGSYKDQIAAQQKRLTGVEPKWIEAAPFELMTADGDRVQLAGGYFPAKYDSSRSTKSMTQEALNTIMDLHKSVRAKTRDSHTKGRAAQVKGRPLRKDFGVIFSHITEVSHRLAWQDWLTDSKRLMAHPDVDQSLREHYGPQMIKELQSALDDIAAGEIGPQNEFETAINHVRTGATIAGLGYNLMTSLMQPLGLTQSMSRIGVKWVTKGLAKWQRMEDALPWIYERSDMMRLRGKTMQREINEVANQVRSPKRAALNDSYFFLIQKCQMVADIPTWLGAFERYTAEGHDDNRAAELADQAVLDSQSGGMLKDLARVQRGSSFQKLFTMFFSFFNSTYNLSVDAVKRTDFKDPASVMGLGMDYLLLYMLPAAMVTLMKAALTGGGDDEDELAKTLVADQISYMMGTMVGIREFGSIVSGFGGYQGPAGTRFFSESTKLATQIQQGEADAAFWKSLDNVGGILLHYPSGQINRTVQGTSALWNDETDNPLALLFGHKK